MLLIAAISSIVIFILAFWRFGARLKLPTSFRLPFYPTKNATSLLISTVIAPPNYRKPPQAPPTFTATPEFIVEETKRQVGFLLPPVKQS